MTTKTVIVHGKVFTVETRQTAKATWFATGEYNGELSTVQGTSENSALILWRDAAIYRELGESKPNP